MAEHIGARAARRRPLAPAAPLAPERAGSAAIVVRHRPAGAIRHG